MVMLEDPRHNPRARIGEINMVGGVTSNEFVQQRRRDGGVEPGKPKAGARSDEIGFNGGELPPAQSTVGVTVFHESWIYRNVARAAWS